MSIGRVVQCMDVCGGLQYVCICTVGDMCLTGICMDDCGSL